MISSLVAQKPMKETEQRIADVLRQTSRAFAMFVSGALFIGCMVLLALLWNLIRHP